MTRRTLLGLTPAGGEHEATEFELTMPAQKLRPIIKRVSDELADEAVTHLSDATVACPELLARLADDHIVRETPASADGA